MDKLVLVKYYLGHNTANIDGIKGLDLSNWKKLGLI